MDLHVSNGACKDADSEFRAVLLSRQNVGHDSSD